MPQHFTVAFSFAGAQRSLVKPLAENVEQRLGYASVFDDDWFEHAIAVQDADLLLQAIYRERSKARGGVYFE